jgi:hypothetical protein
MDLYYSVLKHYKGLFKKRHVRNTHTLMVPISQTHSLYLVLVGRSTEDDTIFYAQLVKKIPNDIVEDLLNAEIDYFEERFSVLEKISCSASKMNDIYITKINNKGKYIKSNILTTFNEEESTNKRRIYVVKAKIDLELSDEITPENLGMVAAKVMAKFGDLDRIKD